MSEIVQLFKDNQKTEKVYPKTLASETYMDDGKTTVSEHLAEKVNLSQVRDINMPSLDYTNVPILVFVDDDCTIQTYNNWFRLCKDKNVKISLACITGWMDGSVSNPSKTPMSITQLKEMYDYGCDVLPHGTTSSIGIGWATENQAKIELENSQKWVKDNGFVRNDCFKNFVYPGGAGILGNTQYTLAKKRTRKYYDNGIDAYATTILPELVYDNFAIPRVPSDGVPYSTLKISLDKTIENKGIMIVLSHADRIADKDSNDYDTWADRYKKLIDYSNANGVSIMTFSEAIKYKGNVLSVGDFDTDCIYVNKNGKSKITIPMTKPLIAKATITDFSANINLPVKNIWSIINFDKFSYNNIGLTINSSGNITVLESGIYEFKTSVAIAKAFPVGGATINVNIQNTSGVELMRLSQQGVDGINYYQIQGSATINLAKNTVVRIGVLSSTDNTNITRGEAQTYLEIKKIG